MFKTLLLLTALVAAAVPQAPTREAAPGFWVDWQWEVNASDPARSAATPAELKALVARLLELREVLKSAPAVAAPVGFNAYLQGHFNGFDAPNRLDLKGKEFPLSARLWFGAFAQHFDKAGALLRTTGETELLSIEVNKLPDGYPPADWRDAQTDIILQPPAMAEVAGLPRFGDTLVLKKNPKPVWAPVSVEATLAAIKKQGQKDVATFEDAARRIRKSYEDWIDPAKKTAREQQEKTRAAKAKDPDAALAAETKRDKDTETALKKQVDTDGDPVANRMWAAAIARVKDVDDALASLPADRRAAPACYASPKGRTPEERVLSRIVPVETPGCQPVVRRNWDYFDRSLPRTAFQLVTVGLIGRCVDNPSPASVKRTWGCPVNLAFLNSVDWNRVRALMDK